MGGRGPDDLHMGLATGEQVRNRACVGYIEIFCGRNTVQRM